MPVKHKAVGLATIRKLIRDLGEEKEREFFAALTPHSRTRLETLLPSTWLEVDMTEAPETGDDYLAVAARILFPGKPDGIEQLGQRCAHEAFTSVYAAIAQGLTPRTLLERLPRIWRMFNDQGDLKCANVGPTSCTIEVPGLQSMPTTMRRYLGGYLAALFELAGSKNVRVRVAPSTDSARWHVVWDG